jgi:hypothetical protein
VLEAGGAADAEGAAAGTETSIFTISAFVRWVGVPADRGAIEITPYVPLLTNEGLIVVVEWTTFEQESVCWLSFFLIEEKEVLPLRIVSIDSEG